MLRDNEWEYFRGYTDIGSATVVSQSLEADGVPTKIEKRGSLAGDAPEYWIIVQCSLAHRARWILAQLPPEDAELNYLATRQLGGKPE